MISRTPFYIEVLDAAGKKATGYLGAVGAGETLGSEINGDTTFNNDGYWIKTGGWTVSGGKAVYAAGGSDYIYKLETISISTGKLYKTVFTIDSITGGNIIIDTASLWQLRLGGASANTYILYLIGAGGTEIGLYTSGVTNGQCDNLSVKHVTDPPATAVHIVSSLNGMTRDWENIESGFDPNDIASWKIYSIALPGFYLPGVGTFNRGDFTDDNAFFWSSIDLSPYAGTLTEGPIEQLIINKIDTRFKTILVANGYATNIGQHVNWWKESPLAIADLPGMNLRDRDESRTLGCGIYDRTLSIEIEASVSGSDSPETARLIEADIEKAIFVDDTWDGLAGISDITGSRKEAEQKQNKVAKVRVAMEIEYRTIRGDAYTQP